MSTLEIVPPRSGSPPICSPHLMPFHIKYTGPAPISTYFRPKPAPPASFGKSATTDNVVTKDHDATLLQSVSVEATSQTTETLSQCTEAERKIQDGMAKPESQDVDMSGNQSTEIGPSNGNRFVAAFRGRAVHGMEIQLPEGYTGILLKAPEDKKVKDNQDVSSAVRKRKDTNATQRKSVGRRTRGSRHVIDVDEEQVDEPKMDDEEVDNIADDDDQPIRTLELSSRFSSIVVWNPDIPVDEGKDEYLRSLNEWTKLAAEIHHFDY